MKSVQGRGAVMECGAEGPGEWWVPQHRLHATTMETAVYGCWSDSTAGRMLALQPAQIQFVAPLKVLQSCQEGSLSASRCGPKTTHRK